MVVLFHLRVGCWFVVLLLVGCLVVLRLCLAVWAGLVLFSGFCLVGFDWLVLSGWFGWVGVGFVWLVLCGYV